MIRRYLSIEMVDDAYNDMGVRIMMWPYLCPGRIYHPEDETDDDMPAGIFFPLPYDVTHREVIEIRYDRQPERD